MGYVYVRLADEHSRFRSFRQLVFNMFDEKNMYAAGKGVPCIEAWDKTGNQGEDRFNDVWKGFLAQDMHNDIMISWRGGKMETSELVDEEKMTGVGPEQDGTRMVQEHAQTKI